MPPSRSRDLHGSAPDTCPVALLLIDWINDLEFDSGALSPHETQMWRELVYRRGPTTIRIVNTDIRVPHEWSVELNDRRVSELQGDFDAWLVNALRELSGTL